MIFKKKIKNIVILGHSSCQAMRFLSDKRHCKPSDLAKIDFGEYPDGSLVKICEHTQEQIINLYSYPRIAEALSRGKLHTHCWIHEETTGKFYVYNDSSGQYEEKSAST